MSNQDGYARLRKGRCSISGQVYHITFSTLNRSPVFSDFLRARKLSLILKECDDSGRTSTLSFVVMPDHIHWLFQLHGSPLSSCIQRVKSFYTKYEGRIIWNKGFYDHGVRSDENLRQVARYIIANPVRAGLCQSVGCYAHWDAVWL